MVDPEKEASVRAAWENRPVIAEAALRQGVHLPVPVPMMTPMVETVVQTRSIQSHFFRLVHDEVFRPDGQHPYLLHRRIRIIGDGVTVEEQIEASIQALKRGAYHKIQS